AERVVDAEATVGRLVAGPWPGDRLQLVRQGRRLGGSVIPPPAVRRTLERGSSVRGAVVAASALAAGEEESLGSQSSTISPSRTGAPTTRSDLAHGWAGLSRKCTGVQVHSANVTNSTCVCSTS